MSSKKLITYMCTTMIFLSSFNQIYADTAPYELPSGSVEEKIKEVLDLTVESAVSYGLEHNKDIEVIIIAYIMKY